MFNLRLQLSLWQHGVFEPSRQYQLLDLRLVNANEQSLVGLDYPTQKTVDLALSY